MNLIEKLGGYEKVKYIVSHAPKAKSFVSGKVLLADGFDKKYQKYVMCDGVYKFHYANGWDIYSYAWHDFVLDVVDLNQLSSALLEYRRQHNIFEVGDLYVFTEKYSKHSAIHKVDSLKSGKGCIRHATDAEIAAGHRL